MSSSQHLARRRAESDPSDLTCAHQGFARIMSSLGHEWCLAHPLYSLGSRVMFVFKPRFFLGFIAACLAAQSYAQVVRVGSKNFTEQFIVAEIYAQALQNAGIKAQTRTNLGATLIAHAALLNGDIDLYPE